MAPMLERQNFLIQQYALQYHALGKKGKLEIQATKQLGSADALSVAYSPGIHS